MKNHLFSAFTIFLALTSFSISQTSIPGGYVSGTCTAVALPYNVQGDITIHADSSLTINPGVDVFFHGTNITMYIYGSLQAVGTETALCESSHLDAHISFRSKLDVRCSTNFSNLCIVSRIKDDSIVKLESYILF